jgi:predicted transport protein
MVVKFSNNIRNVDHETNFIFFVICLELVVCEMKAHLSSNIIVFNFSKISTPHGEVKKCKNVGHLNTVHMEMMIWTRGFEGIYYLVFKFSKISTSHGVIKKGEEVDHLSKVHMEMMIKNQGIGRSRFMMASSSQVWNIWGNWTITGL